MTGAENVGGVPRAVALEGVTFELGSFEWGSPDRLELAGRFVGLERLSSPGPVLVVHGEDATQRLAPATGSEAWPPPDGIDWRAGFAWDEAPAPFDAVELELATGIAVELPVPGSRLEGPRSLEVIARRATGEQGPAVGDGERPAPFEGERAAALEGEGPVALDDERPAAGQRDDPAAGQDGAAADRADDRPTGGQEDGGASGEGAAGAAERSTEALRTALDAVRRTAERAVAGERVTTGRLASELRAAQGEIEALRGRVADLEQRATSAAEVRAERDAALRQADDLRTALEDARRAADEQQRECARLRRRLDGIRRAVEDGP